MGGLLGTVGKEAEYFVDPGLADRLWHRGDSYSLARRPSIHFKKKNGAKNSRTYNQTKRKSEKKLPEGVWAKAMFVFLETFFMFGKL